MLVPSRGRPEAVDRHSAIYDYTSSGTEILYVVDEDDPKLPEYEHACRLNQISWLVAPAGLGMCGALNWAATHEATSDYTHLGFMGDDHMPREWCHPGATYGFWDRELLSEIPYGRTRLGDKSHIGIVYANDLLQGEKMATAVILSRQIVDTLGYMAPPALKHLCLDLVWCDWGRGLRRLYYRDDVIIEHLHPANGKAEEDEGYRRVNSSEMIARDAMTYYDYRDNGGLTEDLMKLEPLVGQ